MSEGVYAQNPDGSYSPAEPMGWQGSGIDWEVSHPSSHDWQANGYDEDMHVEQVHAHTRLGLAFKMRHAMRKAR